MRKYLIYIPVFLMILIQIIDKKGEYRVYQIVLLLVAFIMLIMWKIRSKADD